MEAYPCGHYPVFEGYDHMQYQIRDPKGFAEMLAYIAEHDGMPEAAVYQKVRDTRYEIQNREKHRAGDADPPAVFAEAVLRNCTRTSTGTKRRCV